MPQSRESVVGWGRYLSGVVFLTRVVFQISPKTHLTPKHGRNLGFSNPPPLIFSLKTFSFSQAFHHQSKHTSEVLDITKQTLIYQRFLLLTQENKVRESAQSTSKLIESPDNTKWSLTYSGSTKIFHFTLGRQAL